MIKYPKEMAKTKVMAETRLIIAEAKVADVLPSFQRTNCETMIRYVQ